MSAPAERGPSRSPPEGAPASRTRVYVSVAVGLLVVLLLAVLLVSRRGEEPAATDGERGSVPATTAGSTTTSAPSTSRSPTTRASTSPTSATLATSTTKVPAPSTGPSPTTVPTAVLRGDGLGFLSFGVAADQAVAAATAAYGPATADSGWMQNTALTPPPTIRIVSWGRLGLVLEQDPAPRFVAYLYRQDQGQVGGPDLATQAGVRLGDTAGTFEATAVGPTDINRAGSTMRCSNRSEGQVCAWVDPTFVSFNDEAPPATSVIVGFWAGSDVSFT